MSNDRLGPALVVLTALVAGCGPPDSNVGEAVSRTASPVPQVTDTLPVPTGEGADLAEEFACPPGATDSGPWRPGTILRWCETTPEGGRRPVYHGPVWRWYRSGQILAKEFYVRGAPHGDWRRWHENGTVAGTGRYDRGALVGGWATWDSTGAPAVEVEYGRGEAYRTDYYPSGQRKAAGRYVASGKVGAWTYWRPDGVVAARCDFGDGLFSLPSDDCRRIAEELQPTGYSRPVPVARLTGDSVDLGVAELSYRFAVPRGWVADTAAGRGDRAPVVFYPRGRSWRDPGANMYVRVMFTDGASFQETVAAEVEGFRYDVAGYEELAEARGRLASGRATVTRTISYQPYVDVDAPFRLVGSGTVYEEVAYIDVSDRVALVAVLSCDSEPGLEASRPALDTLVRSLREAE